MSPTMTCGMFKMTRLCNDKRKRLSCPNACIGHLSHTVMTGKCSNAWIPDRVREDKRESDDDKRESDDDKRESDDDMRESDDDMRESDDDK